MRTFVIGDIHGRRTQFRQLLEMIPRDRATDSLVMLGDLIDRGEDTPGVVADCIELQRETGAPVVVLRGNHEQMLLDFLDEEEEGADAWLRSASGGTRTFEQYTGSELHAAEDATAARERLENSIPPEHLGFLRGLPLYYEDDFAIYVHAGLDQGKHPRDTAPHHLLWARDADFFKRYRGKPCVVGHTPTLLLPLLGRIGRHGIYIYHSAIGLDTGYSPGSPLSCLELPSFTLYQAFADGRTATHHITVFLPLAFRYEQEEAQGEESW